METSILRIIDGDYGLVSLDIFCIQSILYAKLKKVPIQVNIQDSVGSWVLYDIPNLKTTKTVIEKYNEIVKYWRDSEGDLDISLTAKEVSQCMAISNLVKTKLYPVLQFLYWGDQRNCDEFTSKWFMRALPFPFNYIYVNRKKQEVQHVIETLYPLDHDPEVIKEFFTKSASQTVATLSTLLNNSNFFIGEQPTSADVIVYAHIAPLLKLPFLTNDISSQLTMYPNLIAFIKRIDAKYLPDVRRDIKYFKIETNIRQNEDEVSYLAIAILLVSASTLVFGFALKKGLINY